MKFQTDRDIRTALRSMPNTLVATYERVFSEIVQQDPSDRDKAKRIFQWLACSTRPLTLSELIHAVAIKNGETGIDDSDLPSNPDQILTVCGNLVRENGPLIEFIHLSVKEMLFTRPVGLGIWDTEADVQLYLAQECLTYLTIVYNVRRNMIRSHDNDDASSVRSKSTCGSTFDAKAETASISSSGSAPVQRNVPRRLSREWDLLRYAVHYWSQHVAKCERSAQRREIARQVYEFLLDSSRLQLWLNQAADYYELNSAIYGAIKSRPKNKEETQWIIPVEELDGRHEGHVYVHRNVQWVLNEMQAEMPQYMRTGRAFVELNLL